MSSGLDAWFAGEYVSGEKQIAQWYLWFRHPLSQHCLVVGIFLDRVRG